MSAGQVAQDLFKAERELKQYVLSEIGSAKKTLRKEFEEEIKELKKEIEELKKRK